MSKLTKVMCTSVVCVFGIATMFAASAAESPRAAAMNSANRVVTANLYKMPTVPVTSVGSTGNVAVDKETITADGQPQQNPQPVSDCDDGGVRDSEYGVADCMNDIMSCINNGALAGGLNDLFNDDMRNAIINGMGLCSIQVDKCVTSVRRNCANVYGSNADVWIDFNSRQIQPEYYNFVLRKTGLTPNQAENTCMLLDKNTYGSSFAAVAIDGKTTNEYDRNVGAYNSQNGNNLAKANPAGSAVNDGNDGVDGVRGHYARWDATTATCYLRVAAYNKDEQIKNSWLFGAMGDDRLAEVWRAAGDTFSCNKDLFGFSLLNKTDTAAVVGVGGGALLGAGVGAIAGGKKGDSNSSDDEDWCRGAFSCQGCVGYNEHPCPDADNPEVETICNGLTASEAQACQQRWIDRWQIANVECTWNPEKTTKCENAQSSDTSNKGGAGRGALAGAAIGAGAGGVATAITAFVERSNITCHVGDGLNTVPFGKSHSIDTLKDFYVKWNLRLPDTVSPQTIVTDCESWRAACGQYSDMTQCKKVGLNYRPNANGTTTFVNEACSAFGGVCVENGAVAKSHGACE